MIESLLETLTESVGRKRLQRVLAGRSSAPKPATDLDLAVLARHCLRYEEHDSGPRWRDLNSSGTVISDDVWRRVGVEILAGPGDRVQLRAKPWRPLWLNEDPFADAVAARQRRVDQSVPGDPFLGLLRYTTYNAPSQREAVRASLLAPPGSTLLVNLPTGMGKSLCGHILGVCPTGTDERSLTVVVIPTDALNVDQEQRLASNVPHRVSYRGADSKAEKREFARRIYQNQQRILFAAPEAVCQSLRGPLGYAAARGWLRALVIDEAHIVDAWGDSFRPEFQELPGLRRLWLRLADEAGKPGFATLLLSATVTPACAALLRDLFPPAAGATWAEVRDPQARAEPGYWFARCQNLADQTDRLVDAVCHAPRPLLVYTTLKKERAGYEQPAAYARYCAARLREADFGRIEVFDGDTDDGDRRRIVEQWAADQLDVVVATSAFGLGVDKADVRAVIHCCVPESVDRFYQEVGRGGRDGCASASLVLYTDTDLQVARGMAAQRTITPDLGWPRWHRMMVNTVPGPVALGEDRWRIDAGLIPDYLSSTTEETRHNVAWNVRTLQLMARAGMITLDAERPPSPPAHLTTPEQRAEWWQTQQAIFDNRVVRLLDQKATEEAHWREVVTAYRETAQTEANAEAKRMARLLEGRACVLDFLAETYNANGDFLLGGRCGGCPACRRNGVHVRAASDWKRDVWPPQATVSANLARVLDGRQLLFVAYPPGDRAKLDGAVRRLVENGVRTLVLEDAGGWGAGLAERLGERLGLTRIVFLNRGMTPPEESTFPTRWAWQPMPTALAFAPKSATLALHWQDWLGTLLTNPPGYPLVVLIPEDAPDPDRTDRLLATVVPVVDFQTLQARGLL